MLEESINSSPSKDKISIHNARLHRKNKRKLFEYSNSTSDKVVEQFEHKSPLTLEDIFLDELDSEESFANGSRLNKTFVLQSSQIYGANYDPFSDQKLLVAADVLDRSKTHPKKYNKSDQPKRTQGFIKCEDYIESTSPLPNLINFPDTNCGAEPESELGITESELIHVCDEAETRLSNNGNEYVETALVQTPKTEKMKSIVELILEDFCSSPLSTSSVQTPDALDEDIPPPIFHFRRKPAQRTYSRPNAQQSRSSNLETAAKPSKSLPTSSPIAITFIDDDSLSNCSSNLSIQEDPTQQQQISVETLNLNHSQKICENLLNLSLYFNSEEQIVPAQMSILESEETEIVVQDTFSQPLEMATQIPQKENLDKAEAMITEANKTAKETIDEILSLRQKYPISYMRDSSEHLLDEFYGFNVDTNQSPHNSNQKLNDISASTSKRAIEENAAPLSIETILKDYEQILQKSVRCPNITELNYEENGDDDDDEKIIFIESDEESSEECNFFKNFKTQDILSEGNNQDNNVNNFESSTSNNANMDPAMTTTDMQRIGVFQTVSPKEIMISENIQCAAKVMQDTSNIDEGSMGNMGISNIEKIKRTREEIPEFIGFKTASHKAIAISKKAQERAAQILEAVLEDKGSESLDIKSPKTKRSRFERNDNNDPVFKEASNSFKKPSLEENKVCIGFQTASHKTITISKKAQEYALKILQDISNEDLPPDTINTRTASENIHIKSNPSHIDPTNNLKPEFDVGNMQLSEWILENNNNAAKSSEKIEDVAKANEFNDIQLSEWPLDEKGDEILKHHPLQITHKTNLRNNHRHTASNVAIQSSTISDLNTHSHLKSNLTKTIIARKNLLSLSKRKKTTTTLGRRMNENTVYRGIATGTTPLKQHNSMPMMETPITPNLREFFTSVANNTSTPRVQKFESNEDNTNGISSTSTGAHNATTVDADFKRIDWESNNDISNKSHKDCSTLENGNNVTTNGTPKPSPQERIERLSMYGNPPAVSPISLGSNSMCRTLGLRRSKRSAEKFQKTMSSI